MIVAAYQTEMKFRQPNLDGCAMLRCHVLLAANTGRN